MKRKVAKRLFERKYNRRIALYNLGIIELLPSDKKLIRKITSILLKN